MNTLDLQKTLKALGFDPGPIDGLPGRKTTAAVVAFQTANHLQPDGIVGPATLRKLAERAPVAIAPALSGLPMVPWIELALTFLGVREVAGPGSARRIQAMWERAGGWVAAFFRANGGDAVAWCGLFVQNAIATTLPKEPLPSNPLSALAYLKFGVTIPLTAPRFGCIGVKKRKGGGHVFFVVGETPTHFHALGGNQGNAVSVMPIAKSEVEGLRWPSTVPLPPATGPLKPWAGRVGAAGQSEA